MKTPPLKRGPKWMQQWINSLREDIATAQPQKGSYTSVRPEGGKGTVIGAFEGPAGTPAGGGGGPPGGPPGTGGGPGSGGGGTPTGCCCKGHAFGSGVGTITTEAGCSGSYGGYQGDGTTCEGCIDHAPYSDRCPNPCLIYPTCFADCLGTGFNIVDCCCGCLIHGLDCRCHA